MEQILPYLYPCATASERYVEPFVGGGSVFFAINPSKAYLSDINRELITLYRGIRRRPTRVWKLFCSFPDTKDAYYEIRDGCTHHFDIAERAARTLYLSRTCFKGMWRHNSNGQFNVGYGGQDRRWVVSKLDLAEASSRLKCAVLKRNDFEYVINMCAEGDFVFCDPPYCPGQKEIVHSHYTHSKFTYAEHVRLADALHRATRRRVKWALTTSSHPEILSLFQKEYVVMLSKGTGRQPGLPAKEVGEALIYNYEEIVNERVL